MKWNERKSIDPDYNRTAVTMYETDGFRVWKGKILVANSYYSANKWHLERLSDGLILHSAKTAKECRAALEYAEKHSIDVSNEDIIALPYFD